jgi:hypothetical protein
MVLPEALAMLVPTVQMDLLGSWVKRARQANLEILDHQVSKETEDHQVIKVGRVFLAFTAYQENLVYLVAEENLELLDPRDRERIFQ